jgi:Clustered mitochondria
MYGGRGSTPDHEAAMKVAGHELKGLQQYSACGIDALHFPLMAVITYKGFRVVAVSYLPIGEDTIKYGSCDSGKTVHDDIAGALVPLRLFS